MEVIESPFPKKKIDWTTIMDGQCRRLVQGEDFFCTQNSILRMLIRAGIENRRIRFNKELTGC